MAATNIEYARHVQLGQEITAYLNACRKVVTDGPLIIDAFDHMVDGDGTDVSHFDELVAQGIYPTNADAKASWDELQSVNAKLTTDLSVIEVAAALNQVCAKHGIV